MKNPITVCLVGAGSSYSPELIAGVLAHAPEQLPIREIRMTDLDASRLEIMAGLARRMVKEAGRDLAIRHDTRLEAMVDGADFVVTQIRVGGMRARHLDESIPQRYGVIGQETTGPGGMCKALRTVPPMIAIAETVARLVPQAVILNYTNPSGIITEAVTRHTRARIVGLCSGMPGLEKWLRERLTARFGELTMRAVGLNHLGFFHELKAGGVDVTAAAIAYLEEQEKAQAQPDANTLNWLALAGTLGALPMRGYTDMFFRRARRVREQAAQPRTRAMAIAGIEREIFAEAANPDITSKPKFLAKRGGGGYSDITFSVLKAILGDSGQEIVASVRNHGAVSDLPADAAVEMTCRIGRDGAIPLPVGTLPLAIRGLIQAVKAYETLTIEAALRREKRLVVQALLSHPLIGDLDIAEPLAADLLLSHGLDFR